MRSIQSARIGRLGVARVAGEAVETALEVDLIGVDLGDDQLVVDAAARRIRRLRTPVVHHVAEDVDLADAERPVEHVERPRRCGLDAASAPVFV